MSTLPHVDRDVVARRATRPQLAAGFYAFAMPVTRRRDEDGKAPAYNVTLMPLVDEADAESVDRDFSVNQFTALDTAALNDLYEKRAIKFMLENSSKFAQAVFKDLPERPQYFDRVPYIDGEEVDFATARKASIDATTAAANHLIDLWSGSDEELTAAFARNVVYGKVSYYVPKSGKNAGEEQQSLQFYRELPEDVQLLDHDEWEYYPDAE